jgi:hypothetical protein
MGSRPCKTACPPRPTDEIKRRIQRDLGKPVSELFVRFNEEPIASASLGQVHEAYLADGRHVAVKVQHADIDDVVRLDLATIRRIMHIASAFLPAKNLDTYYRQIRAMIQEELDFEREAKNIERIMQNFVNDPLVVFPKPVAELSTKTVMTTTFVFGFKVNDLKRIDEAKIDRKALARKIVETFCHMIFVDGIYHADPHPREHAGRREGRVGAARLRRRRGALARDARGHPGVPRGGHPARHRAAHPRPQEDGLHLARGLRGRERAGGRVLPPALPGGREARELQPEGHQARPPSAASRT